MLRDNRLTTVSGQAGVGKTRLVDALLAELSDVDPTITEATFVPLAEVTRPELVVPAIAARLGIVEGRARSPFERIVEALEKRHHLLVLDNFEHLRSAAGEVARLIERCPQLRILVTSRVPLRHRPERVLTLQPLDLPPSVDPAVLVKEPAVAMFADIAERSGGAAVNEETVDDVAAICRLLEGNPLAIELAAARTNVMGPRQILDLMAGGSSLDVLREGPVDLPSRHRDVTAALRWSYRLLGEREAALLRRLSVFPSWFSFAAAQTVSGGDVGSVLDALSALVDTHLVNVDEAAAERRYRLPFIVREFASRVLDAHPDERDDARRRHLDHTARVATAAVDAIHGPTIVRRSQRAGHCGGRHHSGHQGGGVPRGRDYGGPVRPRPERALAASGCPPRPAEPRRGGGGAGCRPPAGAGRRAVRLARLRRRPAARQRRALRQPPDRASPDHRSRRGTSDWRSQRSSPDTFVRRPVDAYSRDPRSARRSP